LESLKGPIVLIAGGRDKGFDFGYLRPLVQEKVRHLVLMGECREKMRDALAEAAPVHLVDGLSQAVQAAASLAAPGETVLLSPACASFDMFKDYRDRGEAFVKAVWALSDQVGP
jgi:UDP-N-acetylmuramoylalanine--D-glutamate ligase